VRAMEPRVSSARTQLSTHLTAALEGALTSKAHSAALHCLHAYAELGETATAEVRRLSGDGLFRNRCQTGARNGCTAMLGQQHVLC
jgi:hypothetical protein